MSRPRPRRLARIAALGLAALLVVLVVVLWLILGTERGARWTLARVDGFLLGELKTAQVSGDISGPLELRGLSYQSETMRVEIDRLALDWSLSGILRPRLDVPRLHADGVRVHLTPAEQIEEPPFELTDVELPLDVLLGDVRARDITILSAGAPEPMVINEVALQGTARKALVEVSHLRVRSPMADLDVRGTLEPRGDYPVAITTGWAYRAADWPELSGRGRLEGTLEDLQVRQTVEGPLIASVGARVEHLLREWRFESRVDLERADPSALDPAWPALVLSGRFSASGTLDALTVRATLASRSQEWGDLDGELELSSTGEQWRLARLIVREAQGPGRVSAAGTATLGDAVGFDLRGEWQSLRWPLAGDAAYRTREGTLSVRGTAQDYEISARARLGGQALPSGLWLLAGRGDSQKLALDMLRGDTLEGRIEARGELAWDPRMAWDLSLSGKGLVPAATWPKWPGTLGFEARSRGTLTDAGPAGTVDFDLDWSGARVKAEGRLGPELELAFSVDVSDLAAIVPDASGSLRAQGNLDGAQASPRVRASIVGSDLAYAANKVAGINADADLDFKPRGDVRLSVEATGIEADGRALGVLKLTGDGTLAEHGLDLRLDAEPTHLHLALQGGLANGLSSDATWTGELRALDLAAKETGEWKLARPVPLTASAASGRLQGFCWVSGTSRLCADGAWRPDRGWTAETTLSALSLELVQPFLPPGLEIRGTLDAKGSASSSPEGVLTADAEVRPSAGTLALAEDGDGQRRDILSYEQGLLRLRARPGGGEADLSLVLSGVGTVAGELRLPDFGSPDPAASTQGRLAGSFRANLSDLGFLGALSPGVGETHGRLVADLAVSGTLDEPRLAGTVRLSEGSADLPTLGLELREMTLSAEAEGDGPIAISGGLKSGSGSMQLEGQAPLEPGEGSPVALRLKGERFTAMATPEIRLLVSPDLQISYDGSRAEVTGDVTVPEGSITVRSAQDWAVPPSPDVVFVDEGAEEAPAAVPVHARVSVVLGDLSLVAFGFKASPKGSLVAIEEPGQVTRGIGQLDVSGGTFKAYGQDLTIERGQLIFASGPIDNPGLDIRAVRTTGDGVKAGFEVRGTLESPELTLWSEPAMAESDALAYLVLGRRLGQKSAPREGSRVADAAGSLGLKGGNLLARKIAGRFGLEEARIESNGALEEASLVLGRYLSPRLYVSYGVGLFVPVSTFRLRYLLSGAWTVQAETGIGTGADLLYSIEKGGSRPRSERPATGEGEVPSKDPV